jgi:hypothetical protein
MRFDDDSKEYARPNISITPAVGESNTARSRTIR